MFEEKRYVAFNKKVREAGHQFIRKELARTKYEYALAHMYIEEGLMSEPGLSLQKIYIEPQFEVFHNCLVENDAEGKEMEWNEPYHPFTSSLHAMVHEVLHENCTLQLKNSTPRLLLILGQPGQGKSSFCKRLLYDYLAADAPGHQFIEQRLFFVRLRDFSPPNAKLLLEQPAEALLAELNRQANNKADATLALEPDDLNNALWVLDGLDELSMQEDIDKKAIKYFIQNLQHGLKDHDAYCLITSRHGRLMADDLEYESHVLTVQLAELALAQQQQWLQKYTQAIAPYGRLPVLTAEDLQQYNEEGSYEHIRELASQPILLHMLTRLEEKIEKGSNRATL